MTSTLIPINPPTASAAQPITGVVQNDGFLPDVDLAVLKAGYRIRDVVTLDRLCTAVVGAMMSARVDLRAWCAARRADGAATLADVPADRIAGESVLVLSYHRAIGAYTRAELIEGYRDTDLTGAGNRKVEDLEPGVEDLRRDAIYAIRDILAVGRTSVELI